MRLTRRVSAAATAAELAIPAGLRELRGPVAIGADRQRFLRLVWRMTKVEWMKRYQGSVLGYAWTILGPLLFALVLYVAFSRVLRFGGGIENYQMVLILNIMLFSAFTDGAGRALQSLIGNAGLLRQLELPRLVLPLAVIATAIITLSLNLVVVLGLALVMGVEPTLTWLLVPPVVVGLLVLTIPVGALLSVVNARFRDLGQAWHAIARALFFASPVMIPIERYPESWSAVIEWNPLALLLGQARKWVIDPGAPSWGEVVGGWDHLIYPLGVFLVLCILAIWAFRGMVGRVAEEL